MVKYKKKIGILCFIVLISCLFFPHVQAYSSAELTSQGTALVELGKNQEGLDILNKALSMDPNNAIAWSNKGVALGNLGRYQEALDAFNKALSIDANNKYSWVGIGSVYIDLGRNQEALAVYEKAVLIDPNFAIALSNKGVALGNLGRYQEALDAFNKALSIDSKNKYSWNGIGYTYFKLKRYQEAVNAYDKALSIDPNFAEVQKNREVALAELGKDVVTLATINLMMYNSSKDTPEKSNNSSHATGFDPVNPDQDSLLFPIPLLVIVGIMVIGGFFFACAKFKRKPVSVAPFPRTLPAGSSQQNHHDVFVSYAQKDKPIADAVCAKLESHNIRCWISPRDVPPGESFPKAIIEGIESSKIMVLIFSSHSNNSQHVIREITSAVNKGLIIIPFRIENILPSKEMEYLISTPHWLDAITPPLEDHIITLITTIEKILSDDEPKSIAKDTK